MADFTVTGRSFFGRDAYGDAKRQADEIAGRRPYDVVVANLPGHSATVLGDIELPVSGGESVCVLECTYLTSVPEGDRR